MMSCPLRVGTALDGLPGVAEPLVDVRRGRVKVWFDPALTTPAQIAAAIDRTEFSCKPPAR